MHKKSAVGVSLRRVVLLAVSLMVLPSFSIYTRTLGANRPAEVATPMGAVTAEAQAVGVAPRPAKAAINGFDWDHWDDEDIGTVDKKVFKMALSAARCAVKSGITSDPKTLTVIDYSKPSTATRFWVFDLRKRSLMFEELVAHGQGSGENYATTFSNEADTHRTSIGLFVTEDTYVGRNGYSLRLNGLDHGFNDHARERAIVMHGAPYVSAAFAKTQGRLGRSWGCPALSEAVARNVIDTVKGGSLVFSYYPDKNWLQSSKYLGDCGAAAD
jgi:L,D-transpeptidase-like protein